MTLCSACLLSDGCPSISFDSNGTCNCCKQFTNLVTWESKRLEDYAEGRYKVFKDADELLAYLIKLLISHILVLNDT